MYKKLFPILLVLVFGVIPLKIQAQFTAGCITLGSTDPTTTPPDPKTNQCPPGTRPINSSGQAATFTNVPNLGYIPLEPLVGEDSKQANFCQLLNLIFKTLIYLGGMAAVLFLVLGGITYMVSEVVDKRGAARERIKAAVLGLVLLLASWIILNTINPQLVTACSILNPTTLPGLAAPSTSNQIQDAEKNCLALPEVNGKKAILKTGDPTPGLFGCSPGIIPRGWACSVIRPGEICLVPPIL